MVLSFSFVTVSCMYSTCFVLCIGVTSTSLAFCSHIVIVVTKQITVNNKIVDILINQPYNNKTI